jgi:hypothetical protein
MSLFRRSDSTKYQVLVFTVLCMANGKFLHSTTWWSCTCGLDMPSISSIPNMATANITENLTKHSTWTQCQNQNIKIETEIKLATHRTLSTVTLWLWKHRTLKTGTFSVIRWKHGSIFHQLKVKIGCFCQRLKAETRSISVINRKQKLIPFLSSVERRIWLFLSLHESINSFSLCHRVKESAALLYRAATS